MNRENSMKNPTVLILAPEADVHARSVAQTLKRDYGVDARITDLRDIARNSALTWTDQTEKPSYLIDNFGPLCLEDITAVWYRRPQRPLPDTRIVETSDRTYMQNEWNTAFHSILRNAVPYWVNPVEADIRAGKKPVQLAAARDIGMRIPRTLITNVRTEVEQFCRECNGEVIFKSLTAHPNRFLETRILDNMAREYLDSLFLSPVLFQEKIRTHRDLRVTVMGERITAAAIDSQKSEYPLDSRIDMGVRHESVELDSSVEEQVRELMKRLGLVYGAVDLIETEEGEYCFLEVNPGGQFLYIELLTSLPLSRYMAELLITSPNKNSAQHNGSADLARTLPSLSSPRLLESCPTTPFISAAPHVAPKFMKSREVFAELEQKWKYENGLEDPVPSIPL